MAIFEPIKPCRCTTGPVEPVNGINKDVCGAKLQPMTVSAFPVDCDLLCHLLDTQYRFHVLMEALTHLQLPTLPHHLPHPPPTHPLIYMPFVILQSLWKQLLKIQQC